MLGRGEEERSLNMALVSMYHGLQLFLLLLTYSCLRWLSSTLVYSFLCFLHPVSSRYRRQTQAWFINFSQDFLRQVSCLVNKLKKTVSLVETLKSLIQADSSHDLYPSKISFCPTYSAMARCDKSSRSVRSNSWVLFNPKCSLQAFKKTWRLSWNKYKLLCLKHFCSFKDNL